MGVIKNVLNFNNIFAKINKKKNLSNKNDTSVIISDFQGKYVRRHSVSKTLSCCQLLPEFRLSS